MARKNILKVDQFIKYDRKVLSLLMEFDPKDLMLVGRFFSHVHKIDSCPIEGLQGGGCWLWTGAKRNKGGYGAFSPSGRRGDLLFAHRVSFDIFRGVIPDGFVIDHLCRVRRCVNPWHLEPVTDRENSLRGISPAAMNAAKISCQNGHHLSGDNLYISKTGQRGCRICRSEKLKAWRRKHGLVERPELSYTRPGIELLKEPYHIQ